MVDLSTTPLAGGSAYVATLPSDDIVTEADADVVVTSYDGLRSALEGANAEDVVWIPGDEEIDITDTIRGDGAIEVTADGVTIASDRGQGGSDGALLYRTEQADYDFGVEIYGDDVRITGLRMRGGYDYGSTVDESDMFDEPDDINMLVQDCEGVEVENCEIFNFRSRGLEVRDSGHTRTIRVHHSSIHHTVIFGNGYGIDNVGSDMVIEANYFNYHRHAIAGNSPSTIREVIRCNVFGDYFINDEIDIHAEEGEGSFGGTAPEWFRISNNLFLGEPSVNSGQSHIHPEAVPAELSYIEGNWFTLDWDSDSPPIRQEGDVRRGDWDNIEVRNNQYGVDEGTAWNEFVSTCFSEETTQPPDDGTGDGGDTDDGTGDDGTSGGDGGESGGADADAGTAIMLGALTVAVDRLFK